MIETKKRLGLLSLNKFNVSSTSFHSIMFVPHNLKICIEVNFISKEMPLIDLFRLLWNLSVLGEYRKIHFFLLFNSIDVLSLRIRNKGEFTQLSCSNFILEEKSLNQLIEVKVDNKMNTSSVLIKTNLKLTHWRALNPWILRCILQNIQQRTFTTFSKHRDSFSCRRNGPPLGVENDFCFSPAFHGQVYSFSMIEFWLYFSGGCYF